MPFIPSSPASAPLASQGNRSAARSGNQDSNAPGSFGEAMARSREAGQEKMAEPAVKTPPSKPVRRPADTEQPSPQDPATPLAALLVPPEDRLARLPEAGQAKPAVGTDPAPPVRLVAEAEKTPAPEPASPLAALLVPPEGRLAAVALGSPVAENQAAPAAAAWGNPLAAAPVVPGGRAGASSVNADGSLQAALASVARPAGIGGADRAPVQAKGAAPDGAVANGSDLRALAQQTDDASAGLPDPSSGQGEQPMNTASAMDEKAATMPLDSGYSGDMAPVAGTGQWVMPAGAALQPPGGMQASNAPTPMASALLLPDVGSSEWGKALGQQVIHLSAADQQVAELQLNPPGLGPLKVTLSLNDQQMQAAFVSAHWSVRTAVEAALPQLRALLAESGISLGQTSVGAESQPQTAFANGQDEPGSHSPRASYRARDADTAALFSAQPVAIERRPGQGLRIDTYA